MTKNHKRAAIFLIAIAFLFLSGCNVIKINTPNNELVRSTGKIPTEYKDPVATITLKGGQTMLITLKPQNAPNTVCNFIALANEGFYDGQEFYNIMTGYTALAGCPNNDGTGDAGYYIQGEFDANNFYNDVAHIKGTLSMLRQIGTDRTDSAKFNTASSQFFLCLNDVGSVCDGYYAAFGIMTDVESLKVVDRISATSTDPYGYTFNPLVIETIRVDTFGFEYKNPDTIKK